MDASPGQVTKSSSQGSAEQNQAPLTEARRQRYEPEEIGIGLSQVGGYRGVAAVDEIHRAMIERAAVRKKPQEGKDVDQEEGEGDE